ncbi:hypothetical protein GF394_00135 [Candidatus Fermentibacteria bacterium]|nr:hypothetical protein [Candidatus Fermentibacteria bacterium]
MLLLLLVLSTTVSGILAVAQTEYATGWDGYYYLVQIKTIVENGEMHSPEYSLVYLPLLMFHRFIGSYEGAYRLSSVLIRLIFVLSVFILSLSLTREAEEERPAVRLYTALFVAGLSALSPSLSYFFTQFPKNLLGFALLLFFMASVMGVVGHWRRNRTASLKGSGVLRFTGVLLLFMATFFTHRFSAVLALLFLLLYALPLMWRKFRSMARRNGWKIWVICGVILLFLASILLLTENLPLAPSIDDLERITQDLSPSPIFVPAAFTGVFGSSRISLPWLVEIYTAALAPLLVLLLLLCSVEGFRSLRGRRCYLILLFFCLIGLFPFLKFTLTGLSYRLFFCTLLLLPLVLLPFILTAVGGVFEKLRNRKVFRGEAVFSAGVILLLFMSFFTARTYRPDVHDPPYGYYRELSDEIMEVLSEREWELIIAHKALAELITYRHGVDALPWAPEEYFHREGVWRVTAGILSDEVAYYIGRDEADIYFLRLKGDYGLLREDKWEEFIRAISDEPVMMEAVDTWRNPMERRPDYLGSGDGG